MYCDVCGKNQATVHLTEIVDEQMSELHLCEDCARQKSSHMEQQFGLSELLAGMAEFQKPPLGKETSVARCNSCGLTYADFQKIGRLGCSSCYAVFKRYLAPLLKRIHGSSQHVGKTPVEGPSRPAVSVQKDDLADLKQRLAKAIEAEAFEEAALLRDKIREAEKKAGIDESQ